MTDPFQKFLHDVLDCICSNPGNSLLFFHGRTNEWNRRLYPKTYDTGAATNDVYATQHMKLFFLEQCPSDAARRALERFAVEHFKYDPWNDIDRYCLKCLGGNREAATCPAWQELRKACAVGELKEAVVKPRALTIELDLDGVHGKAGAAYIGNGDGRVGPIAPKQGIGDRHTIERIAALCTTCKFRREPSVVHGTPSVVRTDGNAADGDSDSHQSDDDLDDSHDGIIAFFRRLFGRGKPACSSNTRTEEDQ